MHGWTDGWILCCLTFRRRPGQFPAVPVVPDSLYAVSGGFRRASNKKLLGWKKGLADAGISGVKQTGGDIVLCAGSMGYLLHRRRVEKKGSRVKNKG